MSIDLFIRAAYMASKGVGAIHKPSPQAIAKHYREEGTTKGDG